MADRDIFHLPFALAHEIGHILGLEHTMYPASSKNPERQADSDWDYQWDYWELMYTVNGGQNVYFSSRTEAFNWFNLGYPLYAKHTWDPGGSTQNCWLDSNCTLRCYINNQWETIGTSGIAGLGFTFPGDNPGQGVYRRGANSMMYLGNDRTAMMVFRPTYSPPTVFMKAGNTCLPGSGETSFAVSGSTPRSLINAVTDMSGDGWGDVLVLDPATNTWTRYYSQSFTPQSGLVLGDSEALPL